MRLRAFFAITAASALASCAAVLALPDPTLDDTIPPGGGSSSGAASSSGSSGGDGATDGGPIVDAGDAGPSGFCTGKPWGALQIVAGLGSNQNELYPSLSDDEMSIVFTRTNGVSGGGGASANVYTAARNTTDAAFGSATQLSVFGTQATAPCAIDVQHIYWTRFDPTNVAGTIERIGQSDAGSFQEVLQAGLDTPFDREMCRSVLPDASVIYFHGESGGSLGTPNSSYAMFRATRSGGDSWGNAAVVSFVDDAGSYNVAPVVRRDELEIFFARQSGDPALDWEIYTATRAKASDPFGAATKVAELSGPGADIPGWLSPDGCRMYFSRDRGDAGLDIWMATRPKE
jgi:hypothetical protein